MTPQVLKESENSAAASAGSADVQAMCDSAMAVFTEMHHDWYRLSRQILGQSLPWPAAEDVAHAA